MLLGKFRMSNSKLMAELGVISKLPLPPKFVYFFAYRSYWYRSILWTLAESVSLNGI